MSGGGIVVKLNMTEFARFLPAWLFAFVLIVIEYCVLGVRLALGVQVTVLIAPFHANVPEMDGAADTAPSVAVLSIASENVIIMVVLREMFVAPSAGTVLATFGIGGWLIVNALLLVSLPMFGVSRSSFASILT